MPPGAPYGYAATPPGYYPQAYAGQPYPGQPYPQPYLNAPLSKVRTLGKAAAILVFLTLVVGLLNLVFVQAPLVSDAKSFLDGQMSADAYLDSQATSNGISGLMSLMQFAAGIVTIIWLYRIATNNRNMGRSGTWGPMWTIFGWILPPSLPIIPALTIQQQWKANDPGSSNGTGAGTDWRKARSSPLIWAWAVSYTLTSVFPLLGMIRGFGSAFENLNVESSDSFRSLERTQAQVVVDVASYGRIGYVVTVIAGALFIAVVIKLTARHTAMTNELTR